jgi:hypothetical protein
MWNEMLMIPTQSKVIVARHLKNLKLGTLIVIVFPNSIKKKLKHYDKSKTYPHSS